MEAGPERRNLGDCICGSGHFNQCTLPKVDSFYPRTVTNETKVLHVGSFGEAEFMLSSIKIIALIVAMLTCLIVSLGGSPNHQRVGFRYWSEPGAFAEYLETGPVGKFLGFFACLVQSCFTYTGTEVVGVAFAETPNPRRNIPRAIRQTLWRISVFYILGVFLLGMAVPYNNDLLIGSTRASTGASASPYVIGMKLGNIGVLPDIMNAAILVFVVSAANTGKLIA